MSGSLSYSPQFLDSIAHPNLLDPAQATIDGNKAAASVWANRLSQAQQAAGQAQLAGVRPDGSFDPAAAALAMGPNTALAAGPTLESNQAIAGRQQEQALKNLTVQSAALDSLGPNATGAEVQAKIHEGMKGGWLQPNEANQVLTGMPMGDDPQSMATRSHMLQVMGDQIRTASERLQSQYGTNTTQTGPNETTIGVNQNQRGGAVSTPQQPGAPLGPTPDTVYTTNTPSATTKGTPVKWTDNQGVEHNTTWAEYNEARGNGQASSAPIVAPGAPPGTGRPAPLVPQQGATPTSPQTAPAAAPAPQRLTDTTGPLPGTAEAGQETARQSAALGGGLVTRADQVPTNKANYANMLSDLSKLDTMGPGTSREATINGVVQKLTGYGVTMNRDQIAGAESFGKIANMIAAQQLGSLGPTDARQSLAMGANPHLDLSKLGNTQIIHMLQGNEDAINAKAQAWQNWTKPVAQGGQGNSAATYGQFSTDFNHNFDPRVFQAQYMGPSEIASLRSSMKGQPGAEAKFMQDHAYAQQQGWIK